MELKDCKTITTKFQEIDNFHSTPHSGIDIACKIGTNIIAQDDGIVTLSTDEWLGSAIRLKIKNGDIVVYGHISEYKVYNNQIIQAGDLLGLSGGTVGSKNSGRTTGEHCHVSLYHEGILVDPTNYIYCHNIVTNNNSNQLNFVIIIILLLYLTYKFKHILFYGLGILIFLITIFIAS